MPTPPSPSGSAAATAARASDTGSAVTPQLVRLRGRARALALEIAAEARAEWAYTSEVIGRAFRTHRELGSTERRLTAETVYGLVRWDRRLTAIVDELVKSSRGRAAESLSPAARDELMLLAYEARSGVDAAVVAGEMKRYLGGEVAPATLLDEDLGLGNTRDVDREALRVSFPTWLLQRFVTDFGAEQAMALATAMNQRAPLAIRVNTAKIDREGLIERLRAENIVARPTPLSGSGLLLETRINAFGLASFQEGLFEVMDEGSQLVAEAVAPPPRGRVLDACAGAGGKTLALGALLGGQGKVLALDTKGKKLEELRRRARRAGLSSVSAREIEPGKPLPPDAKLGIWDRVLVDAPCSGLGTLRRNPEARWRLTEKVVDSFPARQLALLVDYAPFVAVGGRLIYATCTMLSSENERVVERFLAERTDFVPFPLKDIFGRARAETMGDGMNLRLVPQQHETDGFFAAVLRRVK
jgi:16S rRNA (cytosine967-C5)-methyltransferase